MPERETSTVREVQEELLVLVTELIRIDHRIKHLSAGLVRPPEREDGPQTVAEAIASAAEGRLLDDAIEYFRWAAILTEGELRQNHVRFDMETE